MLRPYTPNRKESRSADPRSVRGGAPSFAVTRTLAVDNNPALKAPKSGNGGPFSELGAGHWNSSCRSCVTIFFIDSPAPVFHHAGTAKKESDKGSDVAIMSSKSVAVPEMCIRDSYPPHTLHNGQVYVPIPSGSARQAQAPRLPLHYDGTCKRKANKRRRENSRKAEIS